MKIQRLLMSSLMCAALFIPSTQAEAGLIPWMYDAVFGPPGSLQAWNANRMQYRANRRAWRSSYAAGYAPYASGCCGDYTAGYAPFNSFYGYGYGMNACGCGNVCGCNSCGTGGCANGNCSTGFDPQTNTSEKPTPVSDPISEEKKDTTPAYTPESPMENAPGFDPDAMGDEGFGSGPVKTPAEKDPLEWMTPTGPGSSTSNKIPAPMETPDAVPKVDLGTEGDETSTNPSLYIPPVSIDEKVATWRSSAAVQRTARRVAFSIPTVAHHQIPALDNNQWVPPAPEVIVAQK